MRVDELSKRFGPITAVDGVSLELGEGETLALLGPSGCGKSTLLRLIAGLERPDSGRVTVAGRDITSLPPQKRDMGMVFQDYALFPHLNVAGNVGFALVEKGLPAPLVREQVGRLLELVGLAGMEGRKVFELSGGQQQRVALARALANEPSLLLLDEPLSNLDPELRSNLQLELRGLLETLSVEAVYVTHDQDEAFTVAPRVAVMRRGRIVQEGAVRELLAAPRDTWTARFLGYRNVFGPGALSANRTRSGGTLVRDDLLRLSPAEAGDMTARVTRLERTARLLRLVLAVPIWGVEIHWEGYERELPEDVGLGDELGIAVPEAALVTLEEA